MFRSLIRRRFLFAFLLFSGHHLFRLRNNCSTVIAFSVRQSYYRSSRILASPAVPSSSSSFEEYVKNTIPDWLKQQESLPFACTECGKCCQREGGGDVYMSRQEFTAAAAYLNMTVDFFIRTYSQHVLYDKNSSGEVSWIHFSSKDSDNDDGCVFFEPETKHCKIHAVKPVQCRTYPFYPSLLKSPEAWDSECRRADDDVSSPLPPWTTTAAGCEGMKPIGTATNDDQKEEGVPLQSVLEQVYEYEQHEKELYGEKYESEW